MSTYRNFNSPQNQTIIKAKLRTKLTAIFRRALRLQAEKVKECCVDQDSAQLFNTLYNAAALTGWEVVAKQHKRLVICRELSRDWNQEL